MENIREVQLAELDILKEVIKILDRHNLHYFMIGGTMLGAVRHKGFIPWDDDIDIALPRKEYELFLKYALEELSRPYKLLTCYGKHPCLYAKVHNENTTFIESNTAEFTDYYKGIFIDIMPIDGMPASEKARKKYCKKISNLVKAFNWHRFGFKYCKTLKAKLLYLIPEKLIFNKWEKLIKKYDFENSDYICFTWLHNPSRYIFKSEFFRELDYYNFENILICGPKNYDGYLRTQFNNYTQLPSEKDRINHSCNGLVDLDNSFKKYLKESGK